MFGFGGQEKAVTSTSDLNASQKIALDSLRKQFPDAPREILLGFLRVRNYNLEETILQYQSTVRFQEQNPIPKIHEISPFLRSAPEDGPDGCIFLLEHRDWVDENGKQTCARDVLGRPIIVSVGMIHGNALEMQKQMRYALNRAEHFMLPGQLHASCTVIEVAPRTGAKTTFRFPDANTKGLMDLQKQHYPGSLYTTTHFCGIPSVVTWAFKLCKPFMDPEAYANMNLKPSYAHLPEHIDKQFLLKQWGGDLDFNLDEYIEWRAEEEGVIDLLNDQIRRYDTSNKNAEDSMNLTDAQESMTSYQISHSDPSPRKLGIVYKQGSGVGFFANYKWKKKLLCVGPGGMLVYFDSAEISENNRATKMVSLQGCTVSTVPTGEAMDAQSYGFKVIGPSRSFFFSCDTNDDCDAWVESLMDGILEANETFQQMKQGIKQRSLVAQEEVKEDSK